MGLTVRADDQLCLGGQTAKHDRPASTHRERPVSVWTGADDFVECVRESALEDLDTWPGVRRDNSVRELIEADYSDEVIAERTGVSRRSVARARQRHKAAKKARNK